MSSEESSNDITGYGKVIARRKWSFLIPFLLISAVGAAFAYWLPPIFRSEATVLIQRQAIPDDLVRTTVTGFVQEQIEATRQRIATFENLLEIARKHNLHPDLLDSAPAEAVRQVASSLSVQMRNITATDPDQRGRREATVAFIVAFEANDPEVAQSVTDEVSRRFLTEHKIEREGQAGKVSEFLESEAAILKAEIAEMEQKVAEFKERELLVLPEMMNVNLKLFEKTEGSITQTETRVRQLEDRIDSVRAELALTDPYVEVEDEQGQTLQSASDRLTVLTARYFRLINRYSSKHPDVRAIQREIRVLAEQSGQAARADELLKQIVGQQEALRQARQRYGDQHPEVLALENSVAGLQRGLQNSIVSAQGVATPNIKPDNPRYVNLQSQLAAAESNLVAEKTNLADLRIKLEEYEQRIFRSPKVDSDLRALTLDYNNARKKYDELTKGLSAAELAEKLESGGNAEQFVLTSPAYLPRLPDSPNRIAILALGLMFASIIGLLSASLAEYMDKTIRGAKSVVAALGAPPLVMIPKIPAAQPSARLNDGNSLLGKAS